MMKTRRRARLPDDLATGLEAYRKEHGGNESQIVRQALKEFLDSAPLPQQLEDLAQQLEKLRREMARVGGNLNQIAFYFTDSDLGGGTKHPALAADHEELRTEFKKIIQAIKQTQDELTHRRK